MTFVAAAETFRRFLGKLAAHTELTAEQERAVLVGVEVRFQGI